MLNDLCLHGFVIANNSRKTQLCIILSSLASIFHTYSSFFFPPQIFFLPNCLSLGISCLFLTIISCVFFNNRFIFIYDNYYFNNIAFSSHNSQGQNMKYSYKIYESSDHIDFVEYIFSGILK